MKNAGALWVWVLVCFAVASIGALASIEANTFYGQLLQPNWSPPATVFGPVWTVLYTMIAVAAWLVWCQGGLEKNRLAYIFFFSQLALNALWSWMFFAWRQGAGALINIIMLWLLIVATIICFYRVRGLAGYLLLPYLFWVSFATALNYSLWQLNPQIL